MKILLAEDDPVSSRLLERHLCLLGHDVTIAENGQEAWKILQAENFGLLLTDWLMPRMDGLELVRKIRETDFDRYIYVMMLTSRNSNEDRTRAIEMGVDDFLTKPYSPTEIRIRLQPAIRILQMQEEIAHRTTDLKRSRDDLVDANYQLKKRENLLLEANSVAEWARARFSQLFDGLPVAAFTFDAEGTVFETNKRATKVFNFESHEAFGLKYSQLIGEKFVGEAETAAMQAIFNGLGFEDAPWDDGETHFIVSGYPLVGQGGEISGAIATVIDVTKQRKADLKIQQQADDLLVLNQTLRELSVTDVLTGVPNHRAFKEALGNYVGRFEKGHPFSLVMIDIDHFKLFNDNHGHQAGDEVLRLVGKCLAESVRKSDFVARYGGEEFCLLFGGQEEERSVQLADRVRERVAKIESPYDPITVSMGVAAFSKNYEDAEELIRDADDAMYHAKTEGRNRVIASSTCVGAGSSRRKSA